MSPLQPLEQLKWRYDFQDVGETFYRFCAPQGMTQPTLVHANPNVAALIGLNPAESSRPEFLQLFSGNALLPGMQPLAMKYAGHQFGIYNPALGDGRAILLGQTCHQQTLWDIHLKGAGKTPFSRQGDGRAVLRSCIREYLCSEAMFHLGIETSRALCIINSQEPVSREQVESAATLVRVSQSHLRFGHFEYLYHSGQHSLLAPLANAVIKQHYPELSNDSQPYLSLLKAIIAKTARLIAQWQGVGFCHGVMNTDNMSVIGQTLDYGPFAFLDQYQADYVCNQSDYEGRYAFNRQADIGQWNLCALGLSLTPLISKNDINQALEDFEPLLIMQYRQIMLAKLGLTYLKPSDSDLIRDIMKIIAYQKLDYTQFWRQLSHATEAQQMHYLLTDSHDFDVWFRRYQERWQQEPITKSQQQVIMLANNPKYILRNHLAQRAIELAQQGDFSETHRLFELLQQPYAEQPKYHTYSFGPKKAQQPLSCSS